MDELFAQLSVVSAILGGFAFTFVGALLSHHLSLGIAAVSTIGVATVAEPATLQPATGAGGNNRLAPNTQP